MRRTWSASSIRELARKRYKKDAGEQAPLEDEFVEPAPVEATQAAPELAGKLSYWSQFESSLGDRVIVSMPSDESDDEEMERLCHTLGLKVEEIVPFRSLKIDGATYIGRGNLSKIKKAVEAHACGGVVIDAPLKPSQVKNLEKSLGVPVVDREALILSIFNAHARTKQAQLQVELAQLKYLQSRLAGLWMGLSRQRGGTGGLGGRGLGETRLELDRRVVKRRISILSDKIKESEKVFRTQSARRADSPRAALVGYTNAGKSTLMRRLTKADVLIEDKLFATLDTTVRPLVPPTEPKLLLSDTVGFIKKLPHNLVASFRSTLAEAVESRIILHVVDASDPNWREHFQTTEEVLAEIGAAEVPRLLIFNKTDQLKTALVMREAQARRLLREHPIYLGMVSVSALTGGGLEKLREVLMEHTGTRAPAWARTGDEG